MRRPVYRCWPVKGRDWPWRRRMCWQGSFANVATITRQRSRYERRLMPFLERKQHAAAKFASSFAPATRAGLVFRNLATDLMRFPMFADLFLGRSLRDDIEMPSYWAEQG